MIYFSELIAVILVDAQIAAQALGRSPQLCEDGSDFQKYYQDCVSCITVNSATVQRTTAETYIKEYFQEYLDYCSIKVQTITAVADVTYSGQIAHFTFTTAITLSSGSSVVTSSAETSVNPTSITSNSTSLNPNATKTESNLIPSAEPTINTNANSENKAWIAGPIAGSISGAAVLVLVALLLFYRRRRRHTTRKPPSDGYTDKPQLHSDCVPRAPPDELDAGMRHELPGDEPRDENASVTELPGKDPFKILDKTYGRSELPAYEPEQLPS